MTRAWTEHSGRSRLLVALALGAAAMAMGGAGARASAQTPPATYYGFAGAGDAVAATINGTVCGQTIAGPDGFWLLTVQQGGACGASAGASVSFRLNGTATAATEVWQAGGAPADLAGGVSLAVTTPAPPASEPAGGAEMFSGAPPARGALGLLVTSGERTTTELLTGLDAAGCDAASLAVLTAGSWRVHVVGAPLVVNAAFPAALAGTTAFAVRC